MTSDDIVVRMTQRPPAKKFTKPPVGLLPSPGMAVRLKANHEQVGTVFESDEWWDTLLLRGVDISDQTLVEWQSDPIPVRTWERISQLEQVPAPETPGPAAG